MNIGTSHNFESSFIWELLLFAPLLCLKDTKETGDFQGTEWLKNSLKSYGISG